MTNIDTPSALELQRVIGTRPAQPWPAPSRVDLKVGDVCWISAFGRLRRGIVVKVARVKTTVAFVAPSNPQEVRTSSAPHQYVWSD